MFCRELWHTLVSLELVSQAESIRQGEFLLYQACHLLLTHKINLAGGPVLAGKCANSIDSRWCPLPSAETVLIRWRGSGPGMEVAPRRRAVHRNTVVYFGCWE